jgi:hypothetical protein
MPVPTRNILQPPLLFMVGITLTPSVAGCVFEQRGEPLTGDAAGLIDANVVIDANMIDAPDCTSWSYTPQFFEPCLINPPGGVLELNIPDNDPGNVTPYYLYDTTTGVLHDPKGNQVAHDNQPWSQMPTIRLLSVNSLEIVLGTTLRVVGDHPILIASWGTIDINGTIDVSSQANFPSGQDVGAGANQSSCAVTDAGGDGATSAVLTDGKGSGGGGGGFGAVGGIGGMAGGGPPGTSGAAQMGPPENLRGGCPGGRGGDGANSNVAPNSGGEGGAGGGVLHLAARDTLHVLASGRLHAGGAGGAPGNPDVGLNDQTYRAGGGGGGSGGYIGLEGDAVTADSGAVIAANGGGGGAGALNNIGTAGEDGKLDSAPSMGGTSPDSSHGGNGGARGGMAPGSDGDGLGGNHGGGGGGGGVGRIIIFSSNANIANNVCSPTCLP